MLSVSDGIRFCSQTEVKFGILNNKDKLKYIIEKKLLLKYIEIIASSYCNVSFVIMSKQCGHYIFWMDMVLLKKSPTIFQTTGINENICWVRLTTPRP